MEDSERNILEIEQILENVEFYKSETIKALNAFMQSLNYAEKNYDDPVMPILIRTAVIQKFKLCADIFGKFLRLHLEDKENIISDAEQAVFIAMIEDINRTSHIYKESVADKIYLNCRQYYNFMKNIIDRM